MSEPLTPEDISRDDLVIAYTTAILHMVDTADSCVPQAYGSYGDWEKYCKIRLYGLLPLP